ncbi:MAG: phosphate ABC transporter permease subunit PstC [Acidimicrobiales bacterium]
MGRSTGLNPTDQMTLTATRTPDRSPPTDGGAVGFPAGLDKRVAARIVDVLLLFPFYLGASIAGTGQVAGVVIAALGLGFLGWNQVWRVSRSGASMGKSIMGARVVSATTGGSLGLPRAALREITFLVLSLLSLVTLFRRDRRAIHDLAAGSYASDGIAGDSLRTLGAVDAEALRGAPGRRQRETDIRRVFALAAGTSLLITALIAFSLIAEAWTFIVNVDPAALWGSQWAPRFGEYDIKTLIMGSLIVTAIAMLVALPVGLGSAIYLSEYASPRVRKVLKPALEILAGIPSVVVGFFALRWIAPNVVQRFSDAGIFSLLAAGLGVGLLTIPLMASISEDALNSVPRALREASAGLGATKKTTTVRVVLPAAVSGLAAAFIVTVSRAIGETMVVFLAAGGGGNVAKFTVDPTEPGSTMTAAMAAQASGTDSVVGEALTFESLFFVGLVLFLITLGLNLLADRFVRRVRQAY